jgi:hypothetical protein
MLFKLNVALIFVISIIMCCPLNFIRCNFMDVNQLLGLPLRNGLHDRPNNIRFCFKFL